MAMSWAVWEGNCCRGEKGSLIVERLEIPEKANVNEIAAMLENTCLMMTQGMEYEELTKGEVRVMVNLYAFTNKQS